MDVGGSSSDLWCSTEVGQETNRMTMDAKASERTGMELYLSPFRRKDGCWFRSREAFSGCCNAVIVSAMDRHDMAEITVLVFRVVYRNSCVTFL